MNIKKILSSTIYIFLLSISQGQADDNFNDFLNELENTTKIATKNKVETIYAPGIITILKSEDLKRMGIKDFYEALKLIPSVDIKISPTGTKNIITRGIGGITGSGKTKIMINGIGQNSNASGIIHFNLPIDIIDRIEVIRGPASALYGEYAYSGVINIVTKKDTNSLFYINSNNANSMGTNFSHKNNNLQIDINLAYIDDKGIEPTATDFLSTTKQIETLREEQNFIANITYKDFKTNISLNKAKKGEFYGISSLLPNNDKKENFIYDYKTIELSNKFSLNEKFSIIPKIGILKYNYIFDFTKMVAPMQINGDVKYDKKYLMLDTFYTYKNHAIIAGIEKSQTDEKSNVSNSTIMNTTTTTIKNSDDYSKRELKAVYLQDNIKATNKLDFNVGVRYEKYDDKFNSKLTNSTLSRVAAVYRYNENNIIKFQYGEAFRPPTFLEGTTVKPETIDTYELQYILKKDYHQIKSTIFYSIIQDLIINTTGSTYINKNENIISRGAELEFSHNFNNEYLFNSNISYNDVFEQESKQNLENYSKVLANLSLSYLPYSRFSSTLYIRYIGSKQREITDTRDKLKAQSTCDISFKYLPYKTKNNTEIIFGVKNIFDKNIKSPSSISTISDDLIYSQRSYFIGLNYKF